MQVDIDDTVHIKLEGKMAELLVKIDPKLHRPYVLLENGKPASDVRGAKKRLYTEH